jgi:hypothetical protein
LWQAEDQSSVGHDLMNMVRLRIVYLPEDPAAEIRVANFRFRGDGLGEKT